MDGWCPSRRTLCLTSSSWSVVLAGACSLCPGYIMSWYTITPSSSQASNQTPGRKIPPPHTRRVFMPPCAADWMSVRWASARIRPSISSIGIMLAPLLKTDAPFTRKYMPLVRVAP